MRKQQRQTPNSAQNRRFFFALLLAAAAATATATISKTKKREKSHSLVAFTSSWEYKRTTVESFGNKKFPDLRNQYGKEGNLRNQKVPSSSELFPVKKEQKKGNFDFFFKKRTKENTQTSNLFSQFLLFRCFFSFPVGQITSVVHQPTYPPTHPPTYF
jgi:hypothetical protein